MSNENNPQQFSAQQCRDKVSSFKRDLQNKITRLKSEIIDFDFQWHYHVAYRSEQLGALDDPTEFVNHYKENAAILASFLMRDEIERYELTMTSDLMYCPLNYVCVGSGETLISPAGAFDHERIFVQTHIQINTDNLEWLPKTTPPLVAFDLRDL